MNLTVLIESPITYHYSFQRIRSETVFTTYTKADTRYIHPKSYTKKNNTAQMETRRRTDEDRRAKRMTRTEEII